MVEEDNVTVDAVRSFANEIIKIVVEYDTRELIDVDTAMRIVREVREIVSRVESGTLHPGEAMRILDYKMELVKGLAKTHRVTPLFSTYTRMERAKKVTVREHHRGLSRSSRYYFVTDENRLIHISRYALSQRKDNDRAEYSVDLSILSGKRIVEISSSNSGIFCWATTYPAEDLALEYDQRRMEQVPLSFLNDFEFTHLTQREKLFLQTEWRQYYLPMIEELRRYLSMLKNLNREFLYIGLPSLSSCQIESQANYPLSFLIPYDKNARRNSLQNLTKEIHQLWIAIRILMELNRAGRLRDLYLDFRQSSYYAIASFCCRDGLCSLWYEFDMNPHTMCGGMLWYSEAPDALRQFYQRVVNILRREGVDRASLRPDIAILLGGASCNDLVKGFRVKMIIECKNQSYEHWAEDIDSQIIPYKEIFQPDTMVLASLKKVPKNIKEYLSRYGIVVIDEVYPGGKGIDELLHLVDSALM